MKPTRMQMTTGEKVIAFIERFCRVPDGKLVGQPIKLAVAIATKERQDGADCLPAAGPPGRPEAVQNAQLVSGARSRDQAALGVQPRVRRWFSSRPSLSKIVRVVPSGKRLIGLPMNTEYRAWRRKEQTAHGLVPVLAILDEVGQVKGPQDAFIDAMDDGAGRLRCPC
jgi:hypothetical protein